ncbi:hypothetical protein [Lysobacter terrae]
MINSNAKKVAAVLAIAVGFAGYFYYDLNEPVRNAVVLIDNPENVQLKVKVDGTEYSIPGNTFVRTDIGVGMHTVEAHRGQQVVLPAQKMDIEGFEWGDKRLAAGVINPTRSKYVIYNVVRTADDSVFDSLRDEFERYEVEGREIYSYGGAPKVVDALFIADFGGNGNLNVDPDEGWFSRFDNVKYTVRPKIFRLSDFFAFYDAHND